MSSKVVHTVVAAHRPRVEVLFDGFAVLDGAVRSDGPTSAAARAAYARLADRVRRWEQADLDAEARDRVRVGWWARARLRRVVESLRDSLSPEDRLHQHLPAVESLPRSIPRAARAQLRRSVARLARFRSLDAPEFFLAKEAELIASSLHRWRHGSFEVVAAEFDPREGFNALLFQALRACIRKAPVDGDIPDLGLGAALMRLPVDGAAFARVEAHLGSAFPLGPWAKHPLVPRRLLAGGACDSDDRDEPGPLRNYLEGTSAIGAAAGVELEQVTGDLLQLGQTHPSLRSSTVAAAERVERAGRDGCAVLTWIEYLPAEAEGRRLFVGQLEVDGQLAS